MPRFWHRSTGVVFVCPADPAEGEAASPRRGSAYRLLPIAKARPGKPGRAIMMPLSDKIRAKGAAPLLAGGQNCRCGLPVPVGGAIFRRGQAVPWLDAHEFGHSGLAPDQGVGELGDVADHRPARVLLVQAQGLGPQVHHAVAVIGKQLVINGNGLEMLLL